MCLPGWKKFTTPSATTTPVVVSSSVNNTDFNPTRPSLRTSPISETPSTIAEKISGITIMKMIRINNFPTGWTMLVNHQPSRATAPSLTNTSLTIRPASAPSTRPARIWVGSDHFQNFKLMA